MGRLLTIISLILALLLFPPATLALISNNSIPGDAAYPIKRGLEDAIFTVASITPVTKAWFAAARSDRRFKEFSVLITQGKQAGETLNELVDQTQTAANQINNVSDQAEKAKLVEQLSASIEKYDQGLEQLVVSQPISTPQATSQPQSTFSPRPTPTSTPRSSPSPTFHPTTQPTFHPTIKPTPRLSPTIRPSASVTPRSTSTPRPTVAPRASPISTPVPGREPSPCDSIADEIQRARCELQKIQTGLHAQSSPQETGQQSRDRHGNSSREGNEDGNRNQNGKENNTSNKDTRVTK